eukprot:COSAG01_NODE_37_length_34085_cov_64.376626_12_plen_63_part_00
MLAPYIVRLGGEGMSSPPRAENLLTPDGQVKRLGLPAPKRRELVGPTSSRHTWSGRLWHIGV